MYCKLKSTNLVKFKVISIFIVLSLISGCKNNDRTLMVNRYYIDNQTGNDNNIGTDMSEPWKSLERLGNIHLQPGDSILFANNSVYKGGIRIESSGSVDAPIIISTYGKGNPAMFSNPDQDCLNGNVFQIDGSHIVIDGLSFIKCADADTLKGKSVLEIGAIFTSTSSKDVTIRNCTFTDCPIGVNITGQHSLVIKNIFKDCNRFLSSPNWGPIAVVIGNAYNEVSYNTCSNYVNIGGSFGADGGFIELDDRFFGAKIHDIKIHHNKSFGNLGFLEIETNVTGSNLDVYYNLSDDYQQFIFYWGGDSSKIENNTIIRSRPSLNGEVNTVFTMKNAHFLVRNNIFVVANELQVFKSAPYGVGNYDQVIHEYNLYFCSDRSVKDPCGKPLGKGEIIANPRFLDIVTDNYHLKPESPAIGKGLNLGYKYDLDNAPLSSDVRPSIGAYEE